MTSSPQMPNFEAKVNLLLCQSFNFAHTWQASDSERQDVEFSEYDFIQKAGQMEKMAD